VQIEFRKCKLGEIQGKIKKKNSNVMVGNFFYFSFWVTKDANKCVSC